MNTENNLFSGSKLNGCIVRSCKLLAIFYKTNRMKVNLFTLTKKLKYENINSIEVKNGYDIFLIHLKKRPSSNNLNVGQFIAALNVNERAH